jgi:hypothetical protein
MPLIPDAALTETGFTATNVTIYMSGEMMGNYHRIEARSVTIRVREFAQYSNAIEVTWVPKGARKARGTVKTYKPRIVVLPGHGHFVPEALFGKVVAPSSGESVTVQHGLRSGFSPGWDTAFDAMLRAHLESHKGLAVIVDTRGHDVV